ncbi:MAG: hypothetical protein N5P05_000856 [Chroococcopsis gigantea SAG 12.99]|jgi:hypothetical protein|nr:hypothetical protein [Chlorogloea purpurea SAG 13.99]MDV2999250.1 hypothetical protein [Chroococcopsis gigantea SAG 12.99]
MKRIFLLGFLTLIFTVVNVSPVQAEKINFQWRGEVGYTAKGFFTYDETKAGEKIKEAGKGQMRVLQSLSVSFYDPLGNRLAGYDNVVGGESTGEYFGFNYDRSTGKLFGTIDLGGESPGEIYIKGEIKDKLSLYQVGSAYTEISLDRDRGTLTASNPDREY